jgi:hypothetical protein
VRLPSNAGVLVVGGTAFGQPLRNVDLFLPESQVFRMTSPTEMEHTLGALAPVGTGLAMSAGGAGTAAVETYAFATVTTDTDDYAPGETVYMSGSGWTPNEPVTLVLREVGQAHPDRTFYALADGQGHFENSEFSPEEHHLGVRFYLTATQGASEAQHTFTDAANKATFSTTATGAEISSFTGVTSGTCVTSFLQARQGNGVDETFTPRTATLSSSPSGATFYSGSSCGTSVTSVAIDLGQSSVQFSFLINTATTATYTINGNGAWVSGNNHASASIEITADAAPTVVSINRASASPTYASSVDWTVTFSESITGVGAADFSLVSSGISGSSITSVLGSGTTWTVTADTGSGTGSLGLNLVDDDTIVDSLGTKLGGTGAENGNFNGQVFALSRTLTPAFTADNKVYDGDTSATILTRSFTTVLSGVDVELAGGTASFDNPNVGNTKTVTGIGFSLDGDDAGRFLLSSTSASTTANITKADADCSVTGYNVTYDADSHTATGSCLGVEGETLSGLDLSATTHTNAGTYTADPWTFTDATGNYNDSNGSVDDVIEKATSTTTVTCTSGPFVYNGAAHEPCSVTVTGAGGLNLTPAPVYTNNTDAGTATASYTFPGDANHETSDDSENFSIAKAPSTTTVTCTAGPFVYNGLPHEPCSVSVTGAGGLNLTPAPVYADNTDAGTATASYEFAGDANHEESDDSETFTIDKASSTTTVTCTAGPFVYNGSPHTPCSVSVTGAGGLNLTPAPVYANNTDAGTATASYEFAGDANHEESEDSETFTIDKAPSTTAVTCIGAPFVYNGNPQTPCSASVTGAGGLNLTPLTPTYVDNTNAGTATASYTYGGDPNHTGSSDSEYFTIDKAALTVAALNRTKIFGATMTPDESFPSPDFTVTGIVAGDSVANITLTSPGYAAGAAPGSHTITPSNATGTGLANYDISYPTGTLSVTFAFGPCLGSPGRTILNPINPDGSSVFKQKSTVPAKFRVCDANGNSVGLPGTVIGFGMLMSSSNNYSEANEVVDSTTPDTAFRWSPTDQLWIFNISTRSLAANKGYLFRVALSDGTFIDFAFGLK